MIIITGDSGFVGTNLRSYLQNTNKKVVGVSRSPSEDGVDYKNINTTLLNTSSSFIHLAGKAHDLKKTSNDKEYFEVNTALTKTLFDQFLNSTCEVFIYMSSVKAVADTAEGKLDENFEPIPVTAYGKSKLAAENYILSKNISKNKRVYILRPCMIHGPNNKGNLNLLYSFVFKGVPYPFGKYKNKRSFVSVENLCFIINELVDNNEIDSGVYHIADDGFLSTNALVQLIGESIGKTSRILNIPKKIVKLIALIGDVLSLPINTERLNKLTENYLVSNAKIKKAIKKELPLSIKEGIIKTITSF
jgi:nucleoside-diphosphate-sugar epimerase